MVCKPNEEYKALFEEIDYIGGGSFGFVFKCARIKQNHKYYAIKKIPVEIIDDSRVMREVIILEKLKHSNYVVKYYDHWHENNYYLIDGNNNSLVRKFGSRGSSAKLYRQDLNFILHIQMQFCEKSLYDAIKILKIKLQKKDGIKSLNSDGCYAATELFIQLVEGMRYLHQQSIIHRDLKPGNILIRFESEKHFVKIGDFGLSTLIEPEDRLLMRTKSIGTQSYRAPEIQFGIYDTKSDLYSLGIIAQELFYYNLNNKTTDVNEDFSFIIGIITRLVSYEVDNRLSCDEILSQVESLSICRNTCKNILIDVLSQ